jgi:antitoxin component YwqK of YwqJK toxin-antitoxin module
MRTKLKSSNILKLSSLCIGFILSGEAFSEQLNCTLKGEHVSPYNGATTAGKTGMVICKNEEGKVTREYELKDGKEIGRKMFVRYDGSREEYSVNEKGNTEGVKKLFNKDGKLIREGKYENGSTVGIHREWYDSGAIKSIHSENKMSIDYDRDGKPYNIRCDKEKAHAKEDKEVCGWEKPYEAKRGKGSETFVKGQLTKEIVYDFKGKLSSESVIENGIETTKKFFETGEVKSIATYKGRTPLTMKEFYMNGNVSSEATIKPDGDFLRKDLKTYYDDKTLSSEGSYIMMRNFDQPDGLIKSYWQNSKPKMFENYKDGKNEGEVDIFDENGQLISKRTFAADILKREIIYKDGKVESDYEYYPDGSKKLKN